MGTGSSRRRTSLAVALVLLAAGCKSTDPDTPSSTVALEIETLTRTLEARFADGDLLGVADLYADDAVLFGPDGLRIEGRENIDAYWSSVAEPVAWVLDTDAVDGGGTLAHQRGTSALTALRDGLPLTSEVEFALFWRRLQGRDWKIAVHGFWEP